MKAITRTLVVAGAAGLFACNEPKPATSTSAAPTAASQPAQGQGLPPGHPTTNAASQPAGAAPQPGGLAAEAGPPFTGEVKADASVASTPVKPTDVLFIMARTQGGQLVAVKRVAPVELPMKFEVSAKDLMVPGMPFTGPFVVSARLDHDGDPMTKAGDDLYATASGLVSAGQKNVELVLRAGPPDLPPSGLPNLPTGGLPSGAASQPAGH